MFGEYTKISNSGRGLGISGTRAERSLKLSDVRSDTYAFVRTMASIVPSRLRKMLSWSSEVTSRRSTWIDCRISSISSSPASRAGSNLASNMRTSAAEMFA